MRVRDKQQKITYKQRRKAARTHQIQPERHLPRNTKMETILRLESGQELSLNAVGLTQQEKLDFVYFLHMNNQSPTRLSYQQTQPTEY